MALQRLPFEKDFVLYSGATFTRSLRWWYRGQPVDFTGWDAWLVYGRALDDPVGELTIPNGGLELTVDGHIKFSFTAEQTAELNVLDIPRQKGVGQLFYNLSLKEPSGTIIRFMRGKFLIQRDVPRLKGPLDV